jgi:Fe-S oxidoreductase
MYDPKTVVDLIGRNVEYAGNPFGALPLAVNRWWKGLNIPRDGNVILVTGLMFQFLPLIRKVTRIMERYEDTRLTSWIKYGSLIPAPLVQLGSLAALSGKDFALPEKMLRNVVELLWLSGIRFAYHPDLDLYSGILLYDLGDEDGFVDHAYRVTNTLTSAGIKSIITIDPHTTYAFKVLYPKYVGVSFNVYTYMELLRLRGDGFKGLQVTLHDPCFFGRYLNLSHVPRRLLADLGVEVLDVQQSGTFTHCCGGPAESLSPRFSKEIAARRLEQLRQTGAPILTMCPICFENLKRAGGEVEDLGSFLRRYAE